MEINIRSLLAFFFCLFVFSSAPAKDKNRLIISWAFSDTSTVPEKSRTHLFSENQYLYKMLVSGLSDYHHAFFYGSPLRIEHELKKGPRTCYPASSTAEARKSFSYLTPLYIAPPMAVVLKRDLADKFKGTDGRVSLRKLFLTKTLRPILVEGRSYGPQIDKMIAETRSGESRQLTQPFAVNTVDIINHGRADFSIEYDGIIREYLKSSDRNKDITISPIEEISPSITQYLACSKTPEGLAIIRKADEIIRSEIKKPSYKQGILAFSEAPPDKEFLHAVDEFIKNRNAKPMIIE